MLQFKPVDACEEVLDLLEKRGLILRMTPDIAEKHPELHLDRQATIYASAPERGAHMMIYVTAAGINFPCFGYHEDNEEFLLIETDGKKPLFLLFSLIENNTLLEKIENGTVSEDDFICMRCVYNDPYLSFFTVLKGAAHAEGTVSMEGMDPPHFFVTEPSDIGFTRINLPEREILFES